MDNSSLLSMFEKSLKNMSDKELETALNNMKSLLNSQDYEKFKSLIVEKKNK